MMNKVNISTEMRNDM